MPEAFNLQSARDFATKYVDATSEKQLAQSFWRDFFSQIVGVPDLMSVGIEFEYPVRSSQGTINFVDVLWNGVVLIEHKSAGKDLDLAERQAREYLVALPAAQRPPTIIVSDFRKIRIVEVLLGNSFEFELGELPQHLNRLELVIGGHAEAAAREEVSADQKAVELMANLYVEFEKAGYEGHEVSVFLVRILFLNFGDDTKMWKITPKGLFGDYLAATVPDGSGVGGRLQELFQTLNTPVDRRPASISHLLADFPYVNGGLFSEVLPVFSFTARMREVLVQTNEYDWSNISPAIFGSMFQTVKSKEDRRSLGEHYTSESNILKVIRPLFLDDYTERLRKAWDSVSGLKKLHAELAANNYLDPACGSGNFLVVAYKRLRAIELKLVARMQELEGKTGAVYIDGRLGLSVTLEQFHGFEINEWSSQIATVAMYLADHQANLDLEEVTGYSPNRFPIDRTAHIHNVNALHVDWSLLCPLSETTYIMGNPPFYGARWQDAEQKSDTMRVWGAIKGVGELDFVTNWFLVAARHAASSKSRAAFVATSSVSQGEQPGLVWSQIYPLGVGIDFAYRPFTWTNEASGKAGVHVVIVGFSAHPKPPRIPLWTFVRGRGEPTKTMVSNINAYLLEAPNILVTSRNRPLSAGAPKMDVGSMPNDGGYLSNISEDEAQLIRKNDPVAARYLRRLMGARELIHNEKRYALWLVDADPHDVRTSPELRKRVEAVRELRESSRREATRKLAARAAEFGENRQPSTDYIAVPRITSEERLYVPLGFFTPDVVMNDKISFIADGGLWVFGLLSSRPFNVWNKAVSGRTRNDTLISNSITYNNFPFPESDEKSQARVSELAKAILDVRESFPTSSLADLYDKNSMPGTLQSAHEKLDTAVLACYGIKAKATDEEILAKLFLLYDELTSGLLEGSPAIRRVKK